MLERDDHLKRHIILSALGSDRVTCARMGTCKRPVKLVAQQANSVRGPRGARWYRECCLNGIPADLLPLNMLRSIFVAVCVVVGKRMCSPNVFNKQGLRIWCDPKVTGYTGSRREDTYGGVLSRILDALNRRVYCTMALVFISVARGP